MPSNVLIGVTGSIAAYKAAEIVRLGQGRGWELAAVMTRAATRFVSELTFRTLTRRPVGVDMFAEAAEWRPAHVALAEWAHVYAIAPCSANVIAKLAHGLADDLPACVALAFQGPLVVAPAMNEGMWDHPATRANVDTLRGRGVRIVEVGSGDLACGYQGRGRMAAPEEIVAAIAAALSDRKGEK